MGFAFQEHLEEGVKAVLEVPSCCDWVLPQPFALVLK